MVENWIVMLEPASNFVTGFHHWSPLGKVSAKRTKYPFCIEWMAETTKNTIKNQVTTYRKIFCYQLLEICVSEPLSFTSVKTDIHLGQLDLALAAMRYFAKQMTYQDKAVSQLIDVLHDSRWQIKATAAKLLGEMHAAKAKSALTALLKDDERWVRHNAAYALSLLNPNKEHPWNKH